MKLSALFAALIAALALTACGKKEEAARLRLLRLLRLLKPRPLLLRPLKPRLLRPLTLLLRLLRLKPPSKLFACRKADPRVGFFYAHSMRAAVEPDYNSTPKRRATSW